jgi:AcrR family transcriptional regulator
MSKTAKFDRQQVIEKATNLYWQKGFHATSMRNLQEIIDMRPGSIYAAFGSKDGLFKETLNYYTEQGIQHLNQCIEQAQSPLLGLKAFVTSLVIESQTDAPNGMCMLAKSVAELTEEQGELLEHARSAFQVMEGVLTQVIIDAQANGEIDQDRDPQAVARHVQVQITGLRTYARAFADNAPLQAMIDDMFSHYPYR